MKETRINTNLPAPYAKLFETIGEKSTSQNAVFAISSFIELKRQTIKEIAGLFTENELKYLTDIANATMFDPVFATQKLSLIAAVEDSDRYEGTAKKWDIDLKQLLSKVNKLTAAQCFFLQRETYLYWYGTNKPGVLDEFIKIFL
jgi:hypothetical protein